MKRFKNSLKPELALAAMLLALVLLVCHWQAPRHVLTPGEIDAYLQVIETRSGMPDALRKPLEQRLRAWGEADDGRPFYMLNLMREHDHLTPWPGVQITATTPEQANAFYEQSAMKLTVAQGMLPTVAGDVHGKFGGSAALFDTSNDASAETWTRVLVMRWPSRRAFFDMLSNPEYLKVMPYKLAAVDVALVPMDGAVVVPDLRLLTGALALIVLLAFGWLRSVRHAGKAAN